ncbi:MAG: hypothetical protein Q8P29_02590 [Candidatus Levybacteria bacterium]|nr:hypothetical protein [Candidatus Levybacteria bacterium]MDZ4228282.1 hypothetical protein [Candidatus Levybacteria bacterium]
MISKEMNLGKGQELGVKEREPKIFSNTIVAVDVDGVLIQPIAYRQAINKTINYFAEGLGVKPEKFTLDDENEAFGRSMSHFEANGIHDPWDVSAIIVSLILLKKKGINISCGEALNIYKENPDKKAHPPEVILSEIKTRYGEKISGKNFEEISQYLSNTRDASKNAITGIFQEYILGKRSFEKTYGKESLTGASESLIRTEDRLLVDFSGRKSLEEIKANGGKIVIYTARPGLPPSDVPRKRGDGYSPEAQLAVEKFQIDAIGPVTMGSMEWLSRKTNDTVESLTKPNSIQAIAAILSALKGTTDTQILMSAYDWDKDGKIPEEIQNIIDNKKQKGLRIVVIEDSTSGAIAFVNAKKLFDNVGIKMQIDIIGVHGGSEEKDNNFKRLDETEGVFVKTYTTINDGIREYFEQRKEGKL